MATQVLMPQLGESVEEATITKWLKAEGDTVEEYEALVEVNTDKVDTEIPSPVSGILLQIVQPVEGSIVGAGMILAWIGKAGESIPNLDSTPMEDLQNINRATQTNYANPIDPESNVVSSNPLQKRFYLGQQANLGFISPVVAKIVAEFGINLEKIQGTGLNGRITKNDVLRYLESNKEAESLEDEDRHINVSGQPEALLPHSSIRRRIANHMVKSKHTSPHVTTVFEADMSKIVAHRAVNKDVFAKDGAKLTFTAYFVAATAMALKVFPKVNSSWREDGLLLHPMINIGLATSLGEEGLIVPVIKNADDLSLLGIAKSVNDLAERARNKQLRPNEVTKGTFTITNHGVSGSLFAMPIINQPQCGILGVGKLQKRVIIIEDNSGYDTIAVRSMVYLTLTFDHRILDGAMADYFLSEVVKILENWT